MSTNSIFGLAFGILVGLAFMGGGLYMYQGQQEAIQEHEPVEATVLETSIDREVTRDDDGREVDYYARVTYEYTVDGRTYTSDNVRPAGVSKGYGSRSAARDFLGDYQEGSQVTAHYDPAAPDEAFLVKKASTGLLLFAGIGGLVALFSALGVVKKVVGLVL